MRMILFVSRRYCSTYCPRSVFQRNTGVRCRTRSDTSRWSYVLGPFAQGSLSCSCRDSWLEKHGRPRISESSPVAH